MRAKIPLKKSMSFVHGTHLVDFFLFPYVLSLTIIFKRF